MLESQIKSVPKLKLLCCVVPGQLLPANRNTPSPIDPDTIQVPVGYEPDPADLALSSIPGQEMFDPRKRKFSEEELKPQPMIKKARKVFIPDDLKKERKAFRRAVRGVREPLALLQPLLCVYVEGGRGRGGREGERARSVGQAGALQPESKALSVPEQDDKYWARRRKNNMAAKRSRDARRLKENQIAIRASFLEKENSALRQEVADLRKELGKCKNILAKYEARHGPL
ncbi:Hepatic leukemia factor [Camelus dromedarius]|uniref:Hepatic leukemia factor n=1 Tax=Camelus dromedarius TaxID=9838 RepID=A0A5N4D259_CAMDR|nr:Hepatic leukemia factor [Camelus dromedarius]